ncbi:hypothetical protein ABIE62_001623 [Porphyrobacter sp. MBR-155]|jgi:hypothetical protein|uniref:hypothetical protein n=1 Tax=Porphyrobacter sp. MBR-155 TaxID=3156464 RepID=UPI00339AA33A
MKWRKGSRPWPINVFAVTFLSVGAWQLADNLTKLHRHQIILFGTEISRDEMIVLLSAQFTILCIPVVAIWLFGSRVARWLITIMTAWGALTFLMQLDTARLPMTMEMSLLDFWNLYGTRMAFLVAVILLFAPDARGWFAHKGGDEVAVFE